MTTAFLKGLVFVGDGRILENATVLVDGERIIKLGTGNVEVPKDAQKIDLSGRTLFPGFIDSHIHFCLDGSAYPKRCSYQGRFIHADPQGGQVRP